MDKEQIEVGLGSAHLETTPGKCSPDGKFREYAYSRKVVAAVRDELKAKDYHVFVDYMADKPVELIRHSNWQKEQQRELDYRCSVVNAVCRQKGAKNVLYVSIHVNAAGIGSQWMNARGWCAYTSVGNTRGDKLAECLYDAAEKYLTDYRKTFTAEDLKRNYTHIRTDKRDGDRDFEANYYVLRKTNCAACLTENMFQDNKADVAFLQSEAGFKAIVNLHVEGIIKYIESL